MREEEGVDRVESLVDNDTKWWHTDQNPYSTFHIAAEILKIALNPGNQEDKLIWAMEKDGKYSVKVPIDCSEQ